MSARGPLVVTSTESVSGRQRVTEGPPPAAGRVLEMMPYTDAIIKEALRVHPIVQSLFRQTMQVGFAACSDMCIIILTM